MPAVTVIIPTYNYGRYLGEAIGSILSQTFSDYEVIVVDDGSTDETAEVFASFDDSRLRLIRIEKSGQSVALNVGLDAARGDFIAILDGDDRWRPTKLERQVAFLRGEPEAGAVISDFVRFDESGFYPRTQFSFFPELDHLPRTAARHGDGFLISPDTFVRVVAFGQFPVWMQATMLRSEKVGDLRFSPEIGVEEGNDLHFMLRLYAAGAGLGFIPDVLVEVRRHGSNSSLDLLRKQVGDAKVLRRILDEEPLSPPQRRAVDERLGRAYCGLGYHHFKARSPREAARWYARALRHPGSRLDALRQLAVLPLAPFLASGSGARN